VHVYELVLTGIRVLQTITTVDSTTTKTTTSTETSFETITVIGTKPTDEAQEVAVKRDTTSVVKVKFDLLYKVAPEFVRGVCRGIAQPVSGRVWQCEVSSSSLMYHCLAFRTLSKRLQPRTGGWRGSRSITGRPIDRFAILQRCTDRHDHCQQSCDSQDHQGR